MRYRTIPSSLRPLHTRPCLQHFRLTTYNQQPVPRQSRLRLSLSPHFSHLFTACISTICYARLPRELMCSKQYKVASFPGCSLQTRPVLDVIGLCLFLFATLHEDHHHSAASVCPDFQPWPSCFSAVFCSMPPSPATSRASILHLLRWSARDHAIAAS
jgi:hypothetical protein